MDVLEIKTVFTIAVMGFSIPITETVVICWLVMLVLICASFLLTRKLELIPKGPQVFLEVMTEFLNKFAKEQFGPFAKHLGPYMGTVFLFILFANMVGFFSPAGLKAFGHEFVPPFTMHAPTKDINVTAALAFISIMLVIVSGFAARGFPGWFKNLLHPLPMMLPFNIMDYFTRLISLALRLFGNILGGTVMMSLIGGIFPLILPLFLAVYFDFFDALIQAVIFVFLTSLYISEAVKIHE